jgi:PTH1 family peptidyl-tRNA hydrolase
MQAEHVSIENLLVVTDDIALPDGTIRIRLKGSDGGHNGLKSVQEILNSTQYARLRFGVGSNFPKGRQSDYVLNPWPDDQHAFIEERIKIAAEAVKAFVTSGPVLAMNLFNTAGQV